MKKMKNWVFAATLVCGAGLLMSCTNRHVLFRSGTSSYTIVLDANAPASERYAALELRDWLREVSGVELSIVSTVLRMPSTATATRTASWRLSPTAPSA